LVEDVNIIQKMDSQEVTQKFLGGIKNKTQEERILFLEKKLEKYGKGLAGQLTVCLKDGTPIGLIELNIDEKNNTGVVSYIFDYDYCNNGYCTEACQKLLEIGFNILNLKSINAETVEGNASSRRVLEKLGFVSGADVEVISRTGGNVIVNIKGSRVAIGKEMANKIMV
jgi:ferrous iron transport protein A